jgi:hypothetical protein
MKKFLVLYMVPVRVIDDWKATDADARRAAEDKMRTQWDEWMREHGGALTETKPAGKTKRIAGDGVADTRNDIMLYSLVEAESHDAAAQMFRNHPHLQIPQSSIEVMEVRSMTGD